MLQALMNGVQPGQGRGNAGGQGAGSGGSGSDGNAMQGAMRQNLPVYGPSRMEFDEAALAYGDYRPGQGKRRSRGQQAIDTSLAGVETVDGSDTQINKDAVPLKYKEAVKKYFSKE